MANALWVKTLYEVKSKRLLLFHAIFSIIQHLTILALILLILLILTEATKVTTVPAQRNFKCSQCKAQFYSEYYLEKHVDKQHSHTTETTNVKTTVSSNMPSIQDEKHECIVCKATFASKAYLDTHLRVKHKRGFAHNQASRDFNCKHCSETFFTEDSLQTHVIKKHFAMSYWEKCSFCGEIFETRDELISHTEEKHGLRDKNTASSKVSTPMNGAAIWAFPPKNQNKSAKESSPEYGTSYDNYDEVDMAPSSEGLHSVPMDNIETVNKSHSGTPSPTIQNNRSSPFVQYSPSPVNKELICEMCPFSTNIEQKLNHHLAMEHEYCYLCKKTWSFHNSSGIFYHLSQVHSKELLKCKSCLYVAFSETDIIEHQKSHTGFNLDSTEHSDENPTIDCDNSDLNVNQEDFLNDQENNSNADISIENVPNKSPNKPEKNDKNPGKVEKIQAFGCYICSTVCTVKYCLNKHFKKHHSGTEYEHSKALKLMFKCHECESTFEMYHQIEEHFTENHENLLDPKKIQVGTTMKSAEDLFRQKKKSLKEKDPKCYVETEKCTEEACTKATGYLISLSVLTEFVRGIKF